MEKHNQQNEQSLETRVKELTDENTLLFDQLHVVQEELERYYNNTKESEQKIKLLTEENTKFLKQNKELIEKLNSKKGDGENSEQKIKELSEKNAKLFEQLQVAQESLERYASRLKDYEKTKGKIQETSDVSQGVCATKQMIARLVEAERQRVLAEQQKIAYDVEKKNSRSNRLGNMVLQSSPLAVPGKLLATWRSLEKTPPSCLGGKSFQKLIDIYQAKGNEAVEQLLEQAHVSYIVRANAYTALARHLSKKAPHKAAKLARLAWETDPQPYRMKWLAHRVYEAGDAATAEALLEILPSDLSRTASEERQEERIRLEAALERERLIQQEVEEVDVQRIDAQKLDRITKENEVKKKEIDSLKQQLDQLTKEGEVKKKEIDSLKQQLDQLTKEGGVKKKEIDSLKQQLDQLTKEGESKKKEIDSLKQQLDQLTREGEANKREMEDLKTALEEAEQRVKEREEQAMVALNAQLVEAKNLVEKHRQDIAAADELLSESQALVEERQRENDRLQKELDDTKQLVRTSGLSLDSLYAQQHIADSKDQEWIHQQGVPPLDSRFAAGQGIGAGEQGQENFRLQAQHEAMQRVYQNCLLQLAQQLAEIKNSTMASPGYTTNRMSGENIPSYFEARLREAQGLASEWQQENYRLQMKNEAMQRAYQNVLLQVTQQLAEMQTLDGAVRKRNTPF